MNFCSSRLIELVRAPTRAETLSLVDWDSVVRLARRANLISRLAEGIDRVGLLDRVPAIVRPHLVAALALSRHQHQAIVWETRHLGLALDSIRAPIVLLKGTAYAMAGLRAARGRLFGDVDILVPRSRINEVEAALMLNGWSAKHIDPYDDRYYRQWMHELPPMLNLKRGTVVDVHHNILPQTARNHPSADRLLEAAVPFPGSPFYRLSPCDMVIHSATHLFHEGELHNGLRDLFDLESLMVEFSESDETFWDVLPERAKELDLQEPLRLTVRYLELVLGTHIPERTKLALKSVRRSDRINDLLYVPGFRPYHPLCTSSASVLAHSMLFLRGHYLRMPLGLLLRHLARKAFMRLYKNSSRSI